MTTNSPNKLPYVIGLLIVVCVLTLASWQLFMKHDSTPEHQQVLDQTPEQPTRKGAPKDTQPELTETFVETVTAPSEQIETSNVSHSEVSDGHVLPALDDSDVIVKQALAESISADFLRLLVSDDLIRRVVVYTENLAEGKVAKKHQLYSAPAQAFSVTHDAILHVNPESFHRYDTHVALFTSISNSQLISFIKTFRPLIQEAYEEIGLPDYVFEERLAKAINHLLSTPEVPLDTPLVSESVTYKYAVPEYEALSDAQKQLLRLGPDNVNKVKIKLKQLIKQL